MVEPTVSPQANYKTWAGAARAQILKHVQRKISAYYPEWEGQNHVQAVMAAAPRRKRYTVIFDLALQKNGGVSSKRLIAKSYLLMPEGGGKIKNMDLAGKCQREFLMHQQVYGHFQSQPREFTVVKPLDYLPDMLCLVIERAKGRDLAGLIHRAQHKLMRYGHAQRQLGIHFQRAGKWLAIFHRGFEQGAGAPFEAARFDAQIQWCLERMGKAGVPPQLLQLMAGQFQKASQKFQGHLLPQTQLHGDLKPCHLFVTKRRVIGIDFGNMTAGFAYDDVARMLAEIKLMDLGWNTSMHGKLTGYLQSQFVVGYFGEENWPALLRLYYAYWLCAKWTRRLYKHKWMSHPFVKKTDFLLDPAAVKNFVNRRFISPWFSVALADVLQAL